MRVFALLVALALAATAARARADDDAAEARQQYNLGTSAYRDKRYVEAALHFEAAAAQRAHAVTLYTAALAWEQANRPDRACDDYVRALDVSGLSGQQSSHARDRVASLEKTLGTVVVGGPDSVRVQLEGLTEVAAPARLHGTPGVHTVLAHAAGGAVERQDVTLEAGQTIRVELGEGAPPEGKPPPVKREEPRTIAAPRPAPPTPAAGIRRPLGFALAGVGVATVGAGVVLGIEALDAKKTYDAAPTRTAFDHAHSLQTWTTLAFVAGGVLTVGGVVLVLLPERKAQGGASLALRAAPGGMVAGGAF